MDNLMSSAGQDEDIGAWHPARRPNGNTSHTEKVKAPCTGMEDVQKREADTKDDHFPRNVAMEEQRMPDLNERKGEEREEIALQAQGQADPKLLDQQNETHQSGQDHSDSLTRSSIPSDAIGMPHSHDDPPTICDSILRESSNPNDLEHVARGVGLPGNNMQSNDFVKMQTSMETKGVREEMDHAWDSVSEHRIAYHATSLSRTNSFPDVPPLNESDNPSEDALPISHGDTIISGQKHASGSDCNVDELPPHHPKDQITVEASGTTMQENGSVIAPTMGVIRHNEAVESLDDQEARYMEGLPLVPTNSATKSVSPLLTKDDDLHQEFLHQLQAEDEVSVNLDAKPQNRPHPIDRKNTTQVIEAIEFPSCKGSHQSLKATAGMNSMLEETRPSIADISDGGIASQVLSEQPAESANPEPNSDDLAEMWKAALGDDLLLEETDTSLDPASFFEDDGEGFLDDDTLGVTGEERQVQENLLHDTRSGDGSIGPTQGFDRTERGQAYVDRSLSTPAHSSVPSESAHGYIQSRLTEKSSSHVSQGTNGLRTSASAPNGFGQMDTSQYSSAQTRVPLPPMPSSTQSFADKSKGGYTSPYDLPMDVSRPKKRNIGQQLGQTSTVLTASLLPPPPPRSSSMFTGSLTNTKVSSTSTNLADSHSERQSDTSMPSMPAAKSSSGKFFEELPSSKSRPSTGVGRYAPQTASAAPLQSNILPRQHSTIPQAAQAAASSGPQAYQLLPPEKLSLYGSSPVQQPPSQIVATTNPRYSPAPIPSSNVPPSRHRYASSPFTGSQVSPPQNLPFQPRTSSPLARSISISNQSGLALEESSSNLRSVDEIQRPDVLRPPALRMPSRQYQDHANNIQGPQQPRDSSPLLSNARYAPISDSRSSSSPAIDTPETDRLSSDGPIPQSNHVDLSIADSSNIQHRPPRRSQTQSPDSSGMNLNAFSSIQPNFQRSASFNGRYEPQSVQPAAAIYPREAVEVVQGLSQMNHYLPPSDGRESDPLERWKGCPLVAFGFGGHVVTSFPKHVPRYTSGQKGPMTVCSPGEIKVQKSDVFRLENSVTTFPGPLKSKNKKKEVLEWLQKSIVNLENNEMLYRDSSPHPNPDKGHSEKILLWKTMKVLVEHDGLIDGNLVAERTLRNMLSLESEQSDASANPLGHAVGNGVGILKGTSVGNIPATGSQEAMEGLRHLLLHGDREKAVWHAVDNRMWPYAMLLSSTLEQSVWRQVCSEFIRQELKPFGENTEPLAAMFQIFAGSGDESMDELVPPSARAGLQMVSKITSVGPTKNALDGLDKWRETLTLILGNRTPDDGRALISLGHLLAGYGRIEAAHICYMFAKSPGLFGPPDDPQVSVAIIGADHLRQRFDVNRDFDSILLTEVYEFARTVLASSAGTSLPHLQAYKLYHAMILAEHGFKSEAQQYCDTIASILTAKTKASPYYHGLLFGSLESLNERLRQAPKDGTASWISRPSIDKVSGSLWNKFNQYVAGEDGDNASAASGVAYETDIGPFAKIAGGTPSLSRSPSSADIYSPQSSGLSLVPAQTVNPNAISSRYAPAGLHTPMTEPFRQASQELQKPVSYPLRSSAAHGIYSSRPGSSDGPTSVPYQIPVHQTANAARVDRASAMPQSLREDVSQSIVPSAEYSAPQERDQSPLLSQTRAPEPESPVSRPYYDNSSSALQNTTSTTPYVASSYQPASYEPPASSGYEPPSYDPPSPESDHAPKDSSIIGGGSKKKSMMDGDDNDGDDFEARAAAMRKAEKARKDREADEAFRKAAEEDAQKDKAPKLTNKKSGWFGGWLGSTKEKGEGMHHDHQQQQGNKPIRVKLGEEKSSFYFDKELGKWVNPKATPEDEKAHAPPPPPPRGPPSRAVSGANEPPAASMRGTPPLPPLPRELAGNAKPTTGYGPQRVPSNPASNSVSRSATPANMEGEVSSASQMSLGFDIAGSTNTGLISGPPSAPPSRPTTAQSGAMGIDDLLGAPGQRKAGTVRKGKKGRGYVDVMAK